jgi:hypothetical protein
VSRIIGGGLKLVSKFYLVGKDCKSQSVRKSIRWVKALGKREREREHVCFASPHVNELRDGPKP